MTTKSKEIGDTWEDELGNKYKVIDKLDTVVISESVGELTEERE
ncbi:hypothetical protein J2Z83_003720 [Virgibacillus natechei]|uniref:Uncharacterized protein n=1 Tax=Virgibacillus natechei TaxID=1216297 RepID=A0ABS4IKS2_9BACI|nr:hypothetical protein [Virgibacillus natechei]MBP1971569.1 hypothetical protein [Virgibacillus natechei]UZD13097.1 hypothetical protein OLD84_00520 [Virgibacillus natechei]